MGQLRGLKMATDRASHGSPSGGEGVARPASDAAFAHRVVIGRSSWARRCAGVAAAVAAAAVANAADVRISGPACALPGSLIEVEVIVDPEGATVVGLQALLAYDPTVLRFVAFEDGDAPYVVPIWASVDEVGATVDVAVGFDPENAQGSAPVAIAKRLRFEVLPTVEACSAEGLVGFREEPPFKTMLTVFGGAAVDPDLAVLGGLTVSAPPTIDQPADISITPQHKMDCAVPEFAPPQASAACGAEPMVTCVRSDGAASLDAPVCRLNSPVTFTWTATDSCGRETSVSQVVTVPGLPGDLNLDGMVDAYDLAVVLSAWGSTTGTGDINGDLMVDGFDLSALLSRWTDSIP
jgi:hypothetical protein